jgi:hypothetical protein
MQAKRFQNETEKTESYFIGTILTGLALVDRSALLLDETFENKTEPFVVD